MNRHHKLGYFSSYDRGLDNLLFMWPDIKEKVPDAELHIAYGWDLFDKGYRNNPERQAWKRNVDQMMDQDGIFHYGRIGKEELKELRKSCGIWAYPTYFDEINCITALECQNDGLVPVVINRAALNETVGSGYKISGDIQDITVQDEFVETLIKLLRDAEKWKFESRKAIQFAKGYDWKTIARGWLAEFEIEPKHPTVSVITVTNRSGWWEMMANSLSNQTYTIDEWVIVDDYKQDQSQTAKSIAELYGLNIKYVRGDKALGTYAKKYGLCRANNKGWKTATGELLVWLQDFIALEPQSIERAVDIYNHNPNALQAPTDKYYFPNCEPNMSDNRNWFDSVEPIGNLSWTNIRNTYQGLRETQNPADFEMNYAVTPRHIVEKLNGWWEFFDVTIGYDNTEFAYRALQAGYKILVDDVLPANCLDLDKWVEHNLHGDEAKIIFDDMVHRMECGELKPVREENKE